MLLQVQFFRGFIELVTRGIIVSRTDLRSIKDGAVYGHRGRDVYVNHAVMQAGRQLLDIRPTHISSALDLSALPWFVHHSVLGLFQKRRPPLDRIYWMASEENHAIG